MIKDRCYNERNQSYAGYGGRGITMCTEWVDSFTPFLDHVGRRPGPQYSLERIDNSRGYEPGNVKWATAKEQARNRRTSRILTKGGISRCLAEWAEVLGVSAGLIECRLRLGWSEERALSAPKVYVRAPNTPEHSKRIGDGVRAAWARKRSITG